MNLRVHGEAVSTSRENGEGVGCRNASIRFSAFLLDGNATFCAQQKPCFASSRIRRGTLHDNLLGVMGHVSIHQNDVGSSDHLQPVHVSRPKSHLPWTRENPKRCLAVKSLLEEGATKEDRGDQTSFDKTCCYTSVSLWEQAATRPPEVGFHFQVDGCFAITKTTVTQLWRKRKCTGREQNLPDCRTFVIFAFDLLRTVQ